MRNATAILGFLSATVLFGQGGFNGPGQYEIANIKSGKVMDLDRNNQTTVIQFSSRGTDNQTWYIQPADRGLFFLRNGMNGYALTAVQNGNGAPVQGMPFNGDRSQVWSIEPGKDGNAIITSVYGKCLDVPDGTSRDGVRIQLFDRNGDSNQRFTLRRVGGGRPRWMEERRDEAQVIRCGSEDGRRRYCDADTRRGVRLTRQISGSACEQGRTWGFDDRGIWVDRGCRAEFQLGGGGGRDRDRR
jgi:hypothetical protein